MSGDNKGVELRAHACGFPAFGAYTGQVELVPPSFMRREDGRGICVDVCLALEVTQLWAKGIRTTGCCCGHGREAPYIGVAPEHVEQMKALGYAVASNPLRPDAEDSFTPLSALSPPADAEPSAAWEACFAIRNQLEAAKSSLMFNGRWTNEAGYITDAALWIERAISAAGSVLDPAENGDAVGPKGLPSALAQDEPKNDLPNPPGAGGE